MGVLCECKFALRCMCCGRVLLVIGTASAHRMVPLVSSSVASGDVYQKVVFCSTEEGRVHIVRAIQPHAHIDGSSLSVSCANVLLSRSAHNAPANGAILEKLRPFIHLVVPLETLLSPKPSASDVR